MEDKLSWLALEGHTELVVTKVTAKLSMIWYSNCGWQQKLENSRRTKQILPKSSLLVSNNL